MKLCWVQREVVLAVHERLVAEFGGEAGLRDEGLLESALARPQNLHVYGKPTLFEMAASYAFGLTRNHPFLDGNKRIAFTTAVLFLELNGHIFTATETDAVRQILALTTATSTEAKFALWLKSNCKKA